jgi:hypothetical protein
VNACQRDRSGIRRVGHDPPRGRPDGPIGVVRVPADLGHRLLAPADVEGPAEDHREQRTDLSEHMRELERVHPSPAPGGPLGPKANLELVERRAQRVQRELVPAPANELGVPLLPEVQQV